MSTSLVTEFDEQATALLKEHGYSVVYDVGKKKYRLISERTRFASAVVWPYWFRSVSDACEHLMPINPEFSAAYFKFVESFQKDV